MNPRTNKILLSPENTEGSAGETFRTVGESTDQATGDEMGSEGGTSADTAADENGGKSMLDAVKDHLETKGVKSDKLDEDGKPIEESSTSEDENAEALRSENEHDKKGKEKEEVEEIEEQTEEEQAAESEKQKDKVIIPEEKLLSGKDPIPVDRFKEVIDQRNTVREQIKQVQPIIDDWRALDTTCREAGISPAQFQEMLQVQVLLNTDPVKALPRLEAIVSELKGFTGDKLPDDLQKAVDEGELSVKYAKEVAQVRAQTKFGTRKLEHDRASLAQQQQQRLQQELNTAAISWETAKKNTDPDYKPKASVNEPDGKWELVKAQFISLLNDANEKGQYVNPVKTPAEMTALMDRAYLAVDASLKRFTRRPATRKALRSDGSSNGNENGNGNGKSIEDQPDLTSAVKVGLRQMGHRF